MLMSALVDAGADKKKVTGAIFACQKFLKESKVTKDSFEKVKTHGFSATQLSLSYRDRVYERTGSEMLSALEKMCDTLGLEGKARKFAQNTVAVALPIRGGVPERAGLLRALYLLAALMEKRAQERRHMEAAE